MNDEDRILILGLRAAVQVMFSHLQMKMGLEEQADFKKRIEAYHANILADATNGDPAQRERLARSFSSLFELPSAVDEPADDAPNLTMIDGGKNDD